MLYQPTELENRVAELDARYFNNVRLERGSIAERFFWGKYTDGHTEYNLPDEFSETLDANNYRYVVGTLENAIGETDHKTRTVTIAPGHENDIALLLHEMIHVYLGLYALKEEYTNKYGDKVTPCIPPFIHDALFTSLYDDLKTRIPDLDERILGHANIHSGTEITRRGGDHDILFYLISLDLDLRLGYDLGTICGYGRDEM